MGNKVFVGNLSYSTMDHQLRDAFAEFGEVVSANVVIDRMSGQSRGFGFVEYQSPGDAEQAVRSMDGAVLDGRNIRVNAAHERGAGDRGSRGGGGRRGGHDRNDRW